MPVPERGSPSRIWREAMAEWRRADRGACLEQTRPGPTHGPSLGSASGAAISSGSEGAGEKDRRSAAAVLETTSGSPFARAGARGLGTRQCSIPPKPKRNRAMRAFIFYAVPLALVTGLAYSALKLRGDVAERRYGLASLGLVSLLGSLGLLILLALMLGSEPY